MCEVLPCSSGHWALNTLWKTFFFFCFLLYFQFATITRNQKIPNFATIFSVLLLCIKCSFGPPWARKQIEKQCFLWKCEAVEGRGLCLVGWAALGLHGSTPGFLLTLVCTAAGIPEPGSSGLWDTPQHELAAFCAGQAWMPLERCCSERLKHGNSWVWRKVNCLIVPIRILYFNCNSVGPNVLAMVSSS